jgi:hypothetical protein
LNNHDVIYRSRLRLRTSQRDGQPARRCRLLGVHHSTYYRCGVSLELGERADLFRLAGHAPPMSEPAIASISPRVRRVLDAGDTFPAHVAGRWRGLLAWNGARYMERLLTSMEGDRRWPEAQDPKCEMAWRFTAKYAKAEFEMADLDIAPHSGSGDRGFKSFPPSHFNCAKYGQ